MAAAGSSLARVRQHLHNQTPWTQQLQDQFEEAAKQAEEVGEENVTWTAHPEQSRVIQDTSRFRTVAAGRRGGKTETAAVEALRWAQSDACTTRRPVWWVAPTYQLCRPGILTALELYPEAWIDNYSVNPGNLHIRFPWGGLIEFKSAEREEQLRGYGLTAVVAEELGEWRERAWTEALRATLADVQAPMMGIGTPKGHDWFFRLFQKGLDPDEEDHASFRWTTYDNPHIADAEVDQAKEQLPETAFRQEYLAEFVQPQGSVFPQVQRCVNKDIELAQDGQEYRIPDHPLSGAVYAAGWDVARHDDWSVLCLDDALTRETVYFDRFQQIPPRQQAFRVALVAAKYNAAVLIDATGAGDPYWSLLVEMASGALLEEMEKRDMEVPEAWRDRLAKNGQLFRVDAYKYTRASKQNLVENLKALVGDQDTSWPDIPVLTNEMQIYEYKDSGKSGAPDREEAYDDAVHAKALAEWMAAHMDPNAGKPRGGDEDGDDEDEGEAGSMAPSL